MKKFWALVTVSVWLLGGGGVGWRGDYDRALAEARASRRPLFVVVVRRECAPCREAVAAVGTDEALRRFLVRETVPLLVTEGNEDYPVELLYTREFPALFVLTPEETFLLEPLRGGWENASLLRRLKEKVTHER